MNLRLPGKILIITATLLASLVGQQCKDPYNSPYKSPTTGYLVVEGYISGNTPTSFTLSRTIKLSADTTNPQEQGATVQIEGSDNSTYPLTEQGGGVYSSVVALLLNPSAKYRVRIQTQSGGQYVSDYTAYKSTPPIDSVSWIENGSGVTIYANAHDDGGNTRYYQWNYDETWQYNSAEASGYEFQSPDNFFVRPPQDQVYQCWRSAFSKNILIASTQKLSKDLVYEMPLQQIAANTEPLGVLYSILVRQYALTDSAFNYLTLMEKNTTSMGTIFDPQPSDLTGGNIHSLTSANEPVIGFVCAGAIQQQRIFISRGQLPDWTYGPTACPNKDTIFVATPDNINLYFASGVYTPLYQLPLGNAYTTNLSTCVDCTRLGGTNVAPSFWPN